MRIRKYSRGRRYRRKKPRRYRSKSRRGYRRFRRYRKRRMSTRALVRYTMKTRPKPEIKHKYVRHLALDSSRQAIGEYETNSHFDYSAFLELDRGTASSERIGDKVKLKRIDIRLSMFNAPTSVSTTGVTNTAPYFTPVTILFLWLPEIVDQGPTSTWFNPDMCFKEPPIASLSRFVKKSDDEYTMKYKVLYKKVVNLRQPLSYYNASAQYQNPEATERWVHNTKLSFKFNKVLTFDRLLANPYFPRGRFVLWCGIDSDDSEQQYGSSSVKLQYFDWDVYWYDN